MTLRIEAAGRSHVGLVRRRNEDASYVGRSILAVADGLGGHPAGDVASTTVIDVLRRMTMSFHRPISPAPDRPRSPSERDVRLEIEARSQVAEIGRWNDMVIRP